jgi:hypothetical protein
MKHHSHHPTGMAYGLWIITANYRRLVSIHNIPVPPVLPAAQAPVQVTFFVIRQRHACIVALLGMSLTMSTNCHNKQ